MEQFRRASHNDKRAIVCDESFLWNLATLLECYEERNPGGVERSLERISDSIRMATSDIRTSQGQNSYGLFGSRSSEDEGPILTRNSRTPQTDRFLLETPSPAAKGRKKKQKSDEPVLLRGGSARPSGVRSGGTTGSGSRGFVLF